jgi:hypothetical protein
MLVKSLFTNPFGLFNARLQPISLGTTFQNLIDSSLIQNFFIHHYIKKNLYYWKIQIIKEV